jgi:hypothetical protein
MSSSTSTTTSQFTPVTAPPGKGFVVIPGQTPGAPSVTHPSSQPAVPGPQNDGADFWGLGAALLVIVVAIFVVRKIVPLGRQFSVGRHPTQPPDSPAPSTSAGTPSGLSGSGSAASGSVSPGSPPAGSPSPASPADPGFPPA